MIKQWTRTLLAAFNDITIDHIVIADAVDRLQSTNDMTGGAAYQWQSISALMHWDTGEPIDILGDEFSRYQFLTLVGKIEAEPAARPNGRCGLAVVAQTDQDNRWIERDRRHAGIDRHPNDSHRPTRSKQQPRQPRDCSSPDENRRN